MTQGARLDMCNVFGSVNDLGCIDESLRQPRWSIILSIASESVLSMRALETCMSLSTPGI